MSQRHGILLPGYWGGETGRRIAEYGGKDAQILGAYLTANPDATMLGLYPLNLVLMKALVITLEPAEITQAFDALHRADFATFDAGTGVVWVREMAKFRLGIHVKPLKKDDNRVPHVQRLYATVKPNPFLSQFFTRYRNDLHLLKRRTFQGAWQPLTEGLRRPFQGAGKPVTEQDQYQSQDQVQENIRSTAADATVSADPKAKAS